MDGTWERAARDGDLETVQRLIEAGVDVDARDRYGQTALMRAAHGGHRAVVERLVARGAELDVTAKFNLTALMLAVIAGHAAVVRVLAAAGADPSVRGRGAPGFAGKTAYDLAVAAGLDELRDVLARHGSAGSPGGS